MLADRIQGRRHHQRRRNQRPMKPGMQQLHHRPIGLEMVIHQSPAIFGVYSTIPNLIGLLLPAPSALHGIAQFNLPLAILKAL
jgi:hypothetical protein